MSGEGSRIRVSWWILAAVALVLAATLRVWFCPPAPRGVEVEVEYVAPPGQRA